MGSDWTTVIGVFGPFVLMCDISGIQATFAYYDMLMVPTAGRLAPCTTLLASPRSRLTMTLPQLPSHYIYPQSSMTSPQNNNT